MRVSLLLHASRTHTIPLALVHRTAASVGVFRVRGDRDDGHEYRHNRDNDSADHKLAPSQFVHRTGNRFQTVRMLDAEPRTTGVITSFELPVG